MFTWHHGFWLYFFTRRRPDVWQFVAGSMFPDYIYVVLISVMLGKGQVAWNDLLVMNPSIMMSFLPLYPWAVKIDLIGHSVVIWGITFLFTLLPIINKGQPFVIGWGTHLLIDGLTHAAYANFFLYPISLLGVHSPVSYWEPQYFAAEFRVVHNILIVVAIGYLLYHYWKKKNSG